MISSAFKSAYTSEVSARNQSINNISAGLKDTATLALGIAGFAGGLGAGTVSQAAKFSLANKVGGVGGAIMLSTMEQKFDSTQTNKYLTASNEELDEAFTKMSNESLDAQNDYIIDTVWNKIQKERRSYREQQMMDQLNKNLREGGNK